MSGAVVVAAVFGVLRYTGRDKDVEDGAKKAKRNVEKKRKLAPLWSSP